MSIHYLTVEIVHDIFLWMTWEKYLHLHKIVNVIYLFDAQSSNRVLFTTFIFVFVTWLLAISDEEIIRLVMDGHRPPVDDMSGPADLMSFAKKWIAQCWHQSPAERPSFDSKFMIVVYVLLIVYNLTENVTWKSPVYCGS